MFVRYGSSFRIEHQHPTILSAKWDDILKRRDTDTKPFPQVNYAMVPRCPKANRLMHFNCCMTPIFGKSAMSMQSKFRLSNILLK